MADYLKSDVKVGAVILFCLLLLTGLIFYIGGFQKLESQYEVRILTDSAYGVGKSSIVTYSGVKVGEVTSIRVMEEPEILEEIKRLNRPELNPDDIRVEMVLEVSQRAILRQDSKAEVVGSGLVGDQIVNLTPGTFTAPPLAQGATLVGVELTGLGKLQKGVGKIDFDILVPHVRTTVMNLSQASEKLKTTVDRLDNFLGDLERKNQISSILDDTQKMVEDLNQTIAENSPKISNAISNLNQTSEDVKTELKPILASLRELSENMNRLIVENREKIDGIVAEMKTTATNFNQFAVKVKKYPWTLLKKTKVEKGDKQLFPKTADIKIAETKEVESK